MVLWILSVEITFNIHTAYLHVCLFAAPIRNNAVELERAVHILYSSIDTRLNTTFDLYIKMVERYKFVPICLKAIISDFDRPHMHLFSSMKYLIPFEITESKSTVTWCRR